MQMNLCELHFMYVGVCGCQSAQGFLTTFQFWKLVQGGGRLMFLFLFSL